MLFLYRPRETWMPFSLPRNRTDQAAYNRSLQREFESARHEPAVPDSPKAVGPAPEQIRADLDGLLDAGALTPDEHRAAIDRLESS
ncbi:MAG: hypothetical protein RIB65_15810 [Ilumatobacter fluminis]|uniref:hypothetical protein n=1 Tax=Ilumatobacter fluminis TaxID=467091 RepID=UPI0032F08E7B